jgi:acyl-CoA thioesterase
VLQRAAIGYLSDYWMPLTPLMAHLEAKIGTGLYLASLNHTLWLHRARGWTTGCWWTRKAPSAATPAA